MVTGFSVIDRNIINKYHGVASNSVLAAIADASKTTGADFSYLMEKASVESSFDPEAKAKGSSATGLFQFIDKTWLSMIANHGTEHGLSALAQKITVDDQGRPHVDDPAVKKQILDLRKDPKIAAAMAGEFAVDNKKYLQDRLHQAVGKAELYLAHFMGAGKAANFLAQMKDTPDKIAASVFGREAAANKNVFFDQQSGKPRTLEQIHAFFSSKFDAAPPSSPNLPPPAPVEFASAERTPARPSAHMPQLYKTLDPVNIMIMAQMHDTLSRVMDGNNEKTDKREDETKTTLSGFMA